MRRATAASVERSGAVRRSGRGSRPRQSARPLEVAVEDLHAHPVQAGECGECALRMQADRDRHAGRFVERRVCDREPASHQLLGADDTVAEAGQSPSPRSRREDDEIEGVGAVRGVHHDAVRERPDVEDLRVGPVRRAQADALIACCEDGELGENTGVRVEDADLVVVDAIGRVYPRPCAGCVEHAVLKAEFIGASRTAVTSGWSGRPDRRPPPHH